jgi:putative transposase
LEKQAGLRYACRVLRESRSRYCRERKPKVEPVAAAKNRCTPRKLSAAERESVLSTVHQEPFTDLSVRQIYAKLLDQQKYLCSIATMYRILGEEKETKERRALSHHPARVKPELIATAPKQVWSWDITKIAGPLRWQWFHLYVILDVFSRKIVAWRLEKSEAGTIAEEFFIEAFTREQVDPQHITVHADNGSAMTAKVLTDLFVELCVTRSHSRPHVSNDNPFSESQFKTMKYRPDYPERFSSFEAAQEWFGCFAEWYNNEHHHINLGLLTPADVHAGQSENIRNARRRVLQAAHAAHPERFVKGLPEPPRLASVVYINPPAALAA